MPKSIECDRWQWRELFASEHGPADPSTRLVLFVLALHMNQEGENAWPAQTLIAKRTGLSDRSVRTHLALAVKAGFLKIYQKPQKGKAWFVHEYVAVIPDKLVQFCKEKPWEADPGYQRPEKSAGRRGENQPRPENGAERPATVAERPANDDTTPGNLRHDARQGLPTNSSSNSSMNTPNNTPKNVLAAPRVLDLSIEKPKDPEAEKRAFEAAEAKAEADRAAREEVDRKAREDRANRIKVALKAFPDYDDEGIRRASGVTLPEVQRARRQA